MVSEEFARLVEQPRFGLVGQPPLAQFWLDADKREEWHERMARPPRAWEFVGRFRCSRSDKPVMAITLRMLGSEPAGRKLWAGSMTDISGLAISRTAEVASGDAQNDVEQIAFALSHDLQAPLNSTRQSCGNVETGLAN